MEFNTDKLIRFMKLCLSINVKHIFIYIFDINNILYRILFIVDLTYNKVIVILLGENQLINYHLRFYNFLILKQIFPVIFN